MKDKQPALASVSRIVRWKIESGQERSFRIPTPRPPFRVEVLISPTFVPAEQDPRSTETREFGAQLSFGFSPSAPTCETALMPRVSESHHVC